MDRENVRMENQLCFGRSENRQQKSVGGGDMELQLWDKRWAFVVGRMGWCTTSVCVS